MTDPKHIYRQVMAVAERVETLLSSKANPIPVTDPGRADSPEPLTLATHHSYSLGMYARARSYFRGAILLAKSGLADEALTLGRSLFEESLRLTILAKTDDEVALVDGLTRWLLDGVQRALGGNHKAERLGVGSDHAEVTNHLDIERNKVEGYRQQRGSGRKVANPFNEERLMEAALADGRSDSWWLHEVGDQMVHGNYFAHRMRQLAGADGTALLALQTSEPRALSDVVAYVVESVVVSHQSICAILGLVTMEDLDELLNEVEELQAALSPP